MEQLSGRELQQVDYWTTEEFLSYRVTGLVAFTNKRFKPLNRISLISALSINLWNGSIWGIRKNGSKKLIKRVIN